MLFDSLRTWPPCVTVGPNASAEADESGQGGYGKEDAIANDTNFDMRVILHEGCVTAPLSTPNNSGLSVQQCFPCQHQTAEAHLAALQAPAGN